MRISNRTTTIRFRTSYHRKTCARPANRRYGFAKSPHLWIWSVNTATNTDTTLSSQQRWTFMLKINTLYQQRQSERGRAKRRPIAIADDWCEQSQNLVPYNSDDWNCIRFVCFRAKTCQHIWVPTIIRSTYRPTWPAIVHDVPLRPLVCRPFIR